MREVQVVTEEVQVTTYQPDPQRIKVGGCWGLGVGWGVRCAGGPFTQARACMHSRVPLSPASPLARVPALNLPSGPTR